MTSPPSADVGESSSNKSDSTSATPSGDSLERVLELDDVFEALGTSRSRYLLYTLKEDGRETLPELATKIAAWEEDKPASDVTDDESEAIELSLYHAHVPRLAELDILSYEENEDIIVKAQNTEQVMAVLNGAGAELDSRQEAHARDE